MTRKESVVAESSTFRATSFSSSFCRRSRIWRLVTYLPSRPASGLSLTEKVISTVGSLIFTKGSGSTLAGAAQGVADGDVRQAGEGHDVACGDVVAGLTAIGLEVIQLGQTAAHLQVGVVPVADDHFLAHLGDAVLDAADADAAHELVVVHGGHQHLEGSLGVALGAA